MNSIEKAIEYLVEAQDCMRREPDKTFLYISHALTALRAAQEWEKPLTVEDEIIATPEACPFCCFFDDEAGICLHRYSPCKCIEDMTFGCNLFEPSEQAEGGGGE